MASLQHDRKSGKYRVRFRFAGSEYNRTLNTTDPVEAKATLARVEEIIRLIERGRLDLPTDIDGYQHFPNTSPTC